MGTSLFGLKPKNTYQALLKTTGNTAIDGTLKTISDGLGNDTPLQLSLTDTQINSTLRVHTNNAELLDLEDVASNNRFNINRDVQKINLDFASNPGGSTTQVGAIRTYQDGVNLSDSMSFIRDGNIQILKNLGIGTISPTQNLHISSASNPSIYIQRTSADGTSSRVLTNSNFVISPLAELATLGGAQGSNNGFFLGNGFLGVSGYNSVRLFNTGAEAMRVAGGNVGIGTTTTTAARTHIVGSGATTATTSLLVQNSAGTQILKVEDGARVIVGSSAYLAGTSGLDTANKISCPGIKNNDGASGLDISNGNSFQDFSGNSLASVTINAAYPLYQTRQYSSLSIGTNISQTGTPTTATYKSINLTQTVNQTLGTGKTWGLYIDHTVTAAVDHTIAEFIQGTNSIQFIQNNSSSVMALNSTTKGFLPPRMTTAQKNAIVTPAAGLMVYDTTLNKLCVRTAAAWETINSI